MSIREQAFRFIENSIRGDAHAEREIEAHVEAFSEEDRGLFQEITMGTLRNWHFLNWCILHNAKKNMGERVEVLLKMALYQILFLDRVPEYAVFSETDVLCKKLRISDAEVSFIHAILKKTRKQEWLRELASAQEKLTSTAAPDSDLDWAVLNCEKEFLDTLTVVDNGENKKESRKRAVRALLKMRQKPELIGFRIPSEPHVKFANPKDFLKEASENRARAQADSSQYACAMAAKQIRLLYERNENKKTLKVLEMATGKGGKLLGTLVQLTALYGGDCKRVPELRWYAVDQSEDQLHYLEIDCLPLIKKYWPQIDVKIFRHEWSGGAAAAFLTKEEKLSLVWLDAPCSAYGTLSKHPQISIRVGTKAFEYAQKMSRTQLGILNSVLPLVERADSFFYTVCTMTHPETVALLKEFQKAQPSSVLTHGYLWPGEPPAPESEGFFWALSIKSI